MIDVSEVVCFIQSHRDGAMSLNVFVSDTKNDSIIDI